MFQTRLQAQAAGVPYDGICRMGAHTVSLLLFVLFFSSNVLNMLEFNYEVHSVLILCIIFKVRDWYGLCIIRLLEFYIDVGSEV